MNHKSIRPRPATRPAPTREPCGYERHAADGVGITMEKGVHPEILARVRECRLWQADDYRDPQIGVLVTEPGNLDAPIAFVFENQYEATPKSWVELVQNAGRLATDPEAVDRFDANPCLDLRDRGRAHSCRPIPGWMYGLRLTPILSDAGELEAAGWEPIEWCPLCPIRLAVMVEQLAAKRLRSVKGPQFAHNVVSVWQSDDGQGPAGQHVDAILTRPGNPHELVAFGTEP